MTETPEQFGNRIFNTIRAAWDEAVPDGSEMSGDHANQALTAFAKAFASAVVDLLAPAVSWEDLRSSAKSGLADVLDSVFDDKDVQREMASTVRDGETVQ